MVEVLFEDEDVLVVAKPEGVAAIPERDLARPSVHRQLEAARGERLFVVHRLDKEVSGVLIFARSAEAHRRLNAHFLAREVEKTYLALVVGQPPASGTIDAPLRVFGSGRTGVDPQGKPCLTRYRVRERFAQAALLEVRPETGRRHQIRAHLCALGHPIAGDARYGDAASARAAPRLMLHALRVALPRPPAPPLVVEAEVPPSFEAVLAAARGGRPGDPAGAGDAP